MNGSRLTRSDRTVQSEFKNLDVNYKFILLFFFLSLSSLKFHILLSLQYWEVHVCHFGRGTSIGLFGTHREGWTWLHTTQYGLKYFFYYKKS